MDGILKRLGRVVVGTIGFALAAPTMTLLPTRVMAGNAWDLLIIAAAIALGTVIVLASLRQYELAAFPPGCSALQDPVAIWFLTRQNQLWQYSKILWCFAHLFVLFMPVLMTAFLLVVALRPIYATLQHSQPSPGVFFEEFRRTARFFLATAQGLFFLTLSTLAGTGTMLTLCFLLVYNVNG